MWSISFFQSIYRLYKTLIKNDAMIELSPENQ